MTDKYFATGRGGYGNVRKGNLAEESKNAQYQPDQIPENKTVSTGRGGAGNMRTQSREDDQDLTAQTSAQSPGLMPVTSPTIGRGGYGNVKAGQHSAAGLFARAKEMFK